MDGEQHIVDALIDAVIVSHNTKEKGTASDVSKAQADRDFLRMMVVGAVDLAERASLPSAQPSDVVAWGKDDDFCLHRDFQEYMKLPPHTGHDLERDGDGDYESEATQFIFALFEHAYRKGVWGAARHINDSMSEDIVRYQKEIQQFLNGSHPSTTQQAQSGDVGKLVEAARDMVDAMGRDGYSNHKREQTRVLEAALTPFTQNKGD